LEDQKEKLEEGEFIYVETLKFRNTAEVVA
jgi:hypothetical protein